MKCFLCATPVPEDALAPNFCIECGRPLTQPCPYEAASYQPGAAPTLRLPLCDAAGLATTSCKSCGGLFKACDTCLRLHELDCTACRTPNCAGRLHEPIAAYPGAAGAFDGARKAHWPWSMVAKQPVTQHIEGLYALAFRYGLLIGVSSRNLLVYQWEGGEWKQMHVLGLVNSGDLSARSLQLEQGRAFVLGQDRALVFSLVGGLSKQLEEAGTFLHQAVGPRWWLRAAQGGRLLLTDCETWHTAESRLPAEAGEVTAIASDAQQAYLATARGHVYGVDGANGQAVYLAQHKQRWVRIAVQDSRLALLGYDEGDSAGRMTLRIMSADTKTAYGERSLQSGTISDFAWVGDSLYIARQTEQDTYAQSKSMLETYDARQVTGSPAVVNLSGGMSTQPGMLAVVGEQDQMRLLLRRADRVEQQWSLVDPKSGAQENLRPVLDRAAGGTGPDVDGWPADAPLLCVADSRLVSALRAGGKTTLRTYET